MEVRLKPPRPCGNVERRLILERLVMMAERSHLFPSRTQKLSFPAPMVLGPQGPGRVGRCQAKEERALPLIGGALFVLALCLLVVENCKSTVIFGEITKFPAKACKSAVIFLRNGANRTSLASKVTWYSINC